MVATPSTRADPVLLVPPCQKLFRMSSLCRFVANFPDKVKWLTNLFYFLILIVNLVNKTPTLVAPYIQTRTVIYVQTQALCLVDCGCVRIAKL